MSLSQKGIRQFPYLPNWLCFFRFLFAKRITQYAIRINWVCFFKLCHSHKATKAQRSRDTVVIARPEGPWQSFASFVKNPSPHSILALFFQIPFRNTQHAVLSTNKLALFFQIASAGETQDLLYPHSRAQAFY